MNERILMLRKNLKLSQAEFGNRIGISGPAISKIESGTNSPAESIVRLICATYHVSYKWLTEGVGPMFEAASGDALIDRYAPDAEEHLKAALRVMSALPEESLVALRDYVDDLFRAAEQMRRDGE
jgi:transcriptional regulator with XRE-family HTH domain